MFATETLEFDSARSLQALYANDLRLLKKLEEALHLVVTTRDGWIRFEGEPSQVAMAKAVFQQLQEAVQKGQTIRKQDFFYALNAVMEGSGDSLGQLAATRIQCSARKAPIFPRTANQKRYVQAILEKDLVFGLGPAGTGKTYLAVALAISALKQEKVRRIILTRPAVEAGEALGFLPGDLQEKILPYLRPLYDALYDMLEAEEIQRYTERGVIEIAPLAYMRGRTLNDAFVILDEAQNTTTEQMFMFLTRLGAESKCVVTGDRTQIDLPSNKKSGLIEAIDALRDGPGIAFIQFDERDVVRHELVRYIISAYKKYRDAHPTGKA